MTTALAEKNILVKDGDGNWYAIPPNLKDEFIRINEELIAADVISLEWQDAADEMSSTFGNYAK